MRRTWVWLQLIIGWLPVWALYASMISAAHRAPFAEAALIGFRAIAVAALLGLGVMRLTARLAWPHPMRPVFLVAHLAAAVVYAVAWQILAGTVEVLLRGHGVDAVVLRVTFAPFLVTGMWLYVMVAGVSYATRATERAARAEALAARSQLAALRAQLNPHFLFNALHTVVQLIPREPQRASQAAEQVAGLLRTTIEEDRDLVTLAEELAFVERYLDIERIRFGDRLRVTVDVADDAAAAQVPAFALQTLVENAVRHGAAPRVEPTDVVIAGRMAHRALVVTVRDTGAGVTPDQLARGDGTGLRRLHERLGVLYDRGARLEVAPGVPHGCTATLTVPQERGHRSDG